jgi:Na+-transporting methylmalonyl-CoA/oxaloacetate decarboxylase gamma subunit
LRPFRDGFIVGGDWHGSFMLTSKGMSFLSIALVFVVLIITAVFIAGNKRLSKRVASSSAKPKEPAEIYLGLRNQMLAFTAQQANVQGKAGTPLAYGVLMDLSMSSGTATIVSISTGDTSMYTSTGGGIIGGIGHESCRVASKQFIKTAQDHLQKMQKTAAFPLPPVGVFRFYVLTTEGVFTVDESATTITSEGSPLYPLFMAGNDVITQLRLTAPRQ